MQSIHHYSNILNSLTTINGQLVSLDYLFREVEASTDIDTQFIDSFVASAQEMIVAAEALKSVVYDPTPEEGA